MRESRYVRTRVACVAAALAAGLAGILLTFAPASAASSPAPFSVTFDAVGTGNTAAWATGSNRPDAVLTVSSAANAGANARVILHGFAEDSPMPATEPTFKASPYGAGNPRLVIVTGQDAFYFDYPAGSAGCVSGDCWFLNTSSTPLSYATAAAQINSQGGVNEAWIVADSGGQGAGLPYTTDVTAFTWAGQQLIPGTFANKIIAQDQCGPYTNRLWILRNHSNGVTVNVKAWTVLKSGRRIFLGTVVVPPAGAELTTHQGVKVQIRYGDGLGGYVTATFPATTNTFCP